MNSEWVDNINVEEMVYLASIEDTIKHVLAFYYKSYLLVVREDASTIVVWESKYVSNDYATKSVMSFESAYSFNYFDRETDPQYKKFIGEYTKMVKKLVFDTADKYEIIERFKIHKRKSIIEDLCE